MVLNTLQAILREAESGEKEALERIANLVKGILKHMKVGRKG